MKKFQILDITKAGVNGQLWNFTAHKNGEPHWFRYVKNYFSDIGVVPEVLPFEQIDLSQPWFISLCPCSWTWHSFAGNLLDSFPHQIRQQLVFGNAILIINHEAEAYTDKFFHEMHRLLHECQLKPTKVIYMVGSMEAKKQYEKFTELHQMPLDRQLRVIQTVHVFRMLEVNLDDFACRPNIKKTKKFLSLNRVPREHRLFMVSLMSYYNLFERGYVSLGLYPEDINHAVNDLHKLPIYSGLRDMIFEGFEKMKPNLPLKVDDVSLKDNQVQTNSLPAKFYEETYFSVVSCTHAFKWQEATVGFTEKEIKPILFKQPFLLHSIDGSLKILRGMGFLTFDKWFDESYDYESNDYARMHKLILETIRLSSIPDHEWDKMLGEMQPILLHNYNILVKYNVEHLFFNSDLKELLYYVT
jgi:hypothetical protein